jgi:hypothetical protein
MLSRLFSRIDSRCLQWHILSLLESSSQYKQGRRASSLHYVNNVFNQLSIQRKLACNIFIPRSERTALPQSAQCVVSQMEDPSDSEGRC